MIFHLISFTSLFLRSQFFFIMLLYIHILFFNVLFSHSDVYAFGKSTITWHASCACGKSDKKSDKEVENVESGGEINCGAMGIGVVQKIPYREDADHVHVMFSSGCVRCGLCLAIADQINQTLLRVHETTSCERYLKKAENRLATVCEDSFQDYRLREVKGRRYIGDNQPGSVIIKSTGDGQWAKHLRDKCEEILSIIGIEYLLDCLKKGWKKNDMNFTDILCNGKTGAATDCRGIYRTVRHEKKMK